MLVEQKGERSEKSKAFGYLTKSDLPADFRAANRLGSTVVLAVCLLLSALPAPAENSLRLNRNQETAGSELKTGLDTTSESHDQGRRPGASSPTETPASEAAQPSEGGSNTTDTTGKDTTGSAAAQPGQSMTQPQAPLSTPMPGAQPSLFDSIKPTFPETPDQGALGQPKEPAEQAPSRLNFLDINASSFGRVEFDVQNGHSPEASIDRVHVIADDLDLKEGALKSLSLDVQGGHFPDFIFDQLTVQSQQDLRFDPDVFFNQRVLEFQTPALAEVTATVTQNSLNNWLRIPTTLDRLSVTASKKVSAIASLFGANASNIGVKLSDASCVLSKGSKVSITVTANIGMGGIGLPIPLGLDATLGLQDGWIAVSDTHLNSNGHEISPQISQMLVSKINGMADWGKKNDDIHFSFTDLKVIPNKQFVLKGTATISRLRFAREK